MPHGHPESPEAAAARTLRRRAWVAETLPDRLPLFEMVYAARWERLRTQGWSRNAPSDTG